MSVTTSRVLTSLEHQPIPITSDGSGWSLTPAEAERLAQIGEQRPGFCEIGHRKVKLAQYCGLVSLGGRVLEVLPKTQDGGSSAEECRGVLLRLLRLTQRFPQFQHLPVGQHFQRAPLLEVFISAFFDAATAVIRGGLLKQYQEYAEDLNVVRGRIAIARQLSAHANRPDLVACVYDDLTIDNVWNRVLKKAIRVTRPWIRSEALNRRWVELMGVLSEVDDASLTRAQIERLVFDRKADRYRPAIEWARWILALMAPTLRAGNDEAPALLFDMNKLFELAVANLLRRRFAARPELAIETQDTSQILAKVVTPGGVDAGFSLRPDLVIRHGNAVLAIADTKWKKLERDRKERPMPSEDDMYQMHAYASAFQCTDLVLIYPWHDGLVDAIEAEFHLPAIGDKSPIVRLMCIDVHEDSMPVRSKRGSGLLDGLMPHLG